MSVAFKRFLIMSAGAATTIATITLAALTPVLDLLYTYHNIVLLLPTGAFTLGLLCGSGYGVVGWVLTRLRFTAAMLKAVAVSMFIAYAALVIVEYTQNAPKRMGFFDYFDQATQQATWTKSKERDIFAERDDAPATPVGADGYGYRLVELIGLTLGGMGALFLVPAIRARLEQS